jgi:hypothetical protein
VLIAELAKVGAGDGNRTHVVGLGSRCITIMLHPLEAPLILTVF